MESKSTQQFLTKLTTDFSEDMLSSDILKKTHFGYDRHTAQYNIREDLETKEEIEREGGVFISPTRYTLEEYENPVYTLLSQDEVNIDLIRKLLKIKNILFSISTRRFLILINRKRNHTKEIIQLFAEFYEEAYNSPEYQEVSKKAKNILRRTRTDIITRFLTHKEYTIFSNLSLDSTISSITQYMSFVIQTRSAEYVIEDYENSLENCLVMLYLCINKLDIPFEEIYDNIKDRRDQNSSLYKHMKDGKPTRKIQIYMLFLLNFPLTKLKQLPYRVELNFTETELLRIYSLNYKHIDIETLNRIFNIDFNKLLEELSPDEDKDFFKKPYGRIALEYLDETIPSFPSKKSVFYDMSNSRVPVSEIDPELITVEDLYDLTREELTEFINLHSIYIPHLSSGDIDATITDVVKALDRRYR